ncbi:hypothetical protein GS538_11705 [Rhodococcus hoagii]|nr:hypothetical protein [Prescottella equi]NKR30636.1 hypothetical protein [Prescottella equi]NKV45462.1 hypothetical protein [Prescottella equi]NKV46346.1 hypothetical protein [Prescottella equi]NKV70814.1 hypothetical protein [Prescottella equi]
MKNFLALFVAILALGFVLSYWKWIVGALVVGVVVLIVYMSVSTANFHRRKDRANQRARNHALAARAQAQHEQYLDGDERGLYGNYRPASLD